MKSLLLITGGLCQPRYLAFIGAAILCMMLQSTRAAESAIVLYQQCRAKSTTAEQRECYPAVVRQSEIELAAAEKKVRAEMVELEAISPGSRKARPVLAFDKAEHTYRAFRDAESDRVSSSYGSGNGGGLAAFEAAIEMNTARTRLLNHEEQ
jgi:uncharacterized protein YecT (DUF1311 family)